MGDIALPAAGIGDSGKKASTVHLSNGADVQNVQVGAATEGGSFTPVAIATQATLASVLAALGSPVLAPDAATQTTVAAILAKLNGTIAVTGPLTDTQMRATAVAISAAALPLPAGAATSAGVTAAAASIVAALGTPAQAGGLTNTQLRATPVPVTGGGTPLDLSASGAFTALGQFVTLTPLDGMATMQIDISGTFSGVSWAFEGTIDGTNWVPIPKGLVLTTNTGGQFVGTNLSAGSIVGNYTVPCAGLKGFRVECIAFSSGTMNIALRASAGSNVVSLTNSLPSGGNLIGDVNTRLNGQIAVAGHGVSGTGVQRVELASDSTGQVKLSTVATGGLTTFRLLSANSANLTSVKGSAGRVCVITATNTNAAVRYLKLYDKASAPVLASDTPTHTLAIPPTSTGQSLVIATDTGIAFATGIALATTTGVADTDTGAVALNEVIVHLEYA